MRFPPSPLLAALCLAACSVDVAGSMSGETVDPFDGGGFDSAIALNEGGSFGAEAGAPESCTGVLQQARLRFEQAQVVAPAVCKSETQKRTCSGGTFGAWSGTFQAETCELAPYNSCGSVMHGQQETRTRYAMAVAGSADECEAEQQTRTCVDGTFEEWTGSYQAESCAVAFLGGCSLFGGDFACESGTSCMLKSAFSAACLGSLGHSCAANGECVTGTCVAGSCTLKSAPGGACEEQSDCSGCVGSNTTVSCAQNTCRCSDTASCTANNQCLGTCVSNKCVQANTSCDAGDQTDCRGESVCMKPANKALGCYLPDGKACTSNSNCEHVCRSAECAALAPVGEICDETADCQQSQPMPLECAPYAAGSITIQVCLVASGGLCAGDTSCASGVCSSSGSGGTGTCQ